MSKVKKIIVAIDEIELETFVHFIDLLDCNLCIIKIGSVTFNSLGRDSVFYAASKGFNIFLDLKLHDIPNTVKKSIEGLKTLPINMLTIHTSGGLQMMKAAMQAVNGTNIKVFGVTALTSLTDDDTNIIYQRDARSQVNAMLEIAIQAGVDGVVCSPHELNLIKHKESLLSITPGIRLSDLNDDQSRVMTPQKAIKLGANYLVIGRPITEAADPQNALKNIFNSIN